VNDQPATSEVPRQGDLIRRAAGGAGIATVVAALSRLLYFLQQLVLANLLLEETFGQFAYATLVIGLPALLVNLRGADAIVRSDDDEAGLNALSDTLFTLQLGLAAGMAILVFFGRGVIADVLDKPYLIALLAPMSLLILSASGGPSANTGPMMLPAAVMERRLDFVRARLPELANVLVNAGLSIALASFGFGVWSLVWGFLAGSLVQVILLWSLVRFRPKFRIDHATLRRHFHFAWPLYLSFLLSWGYLNADYYFVGRWLGEAELGLYYMAFNISQVPLQIRFVLSRVALPTFSRARGDLALLGRLYGMVTRYAMALAGCVCAVGIALAEPITLLLLGERWLPAAPALRILLLSAWIRTGMGFNGELLISLGKTATVLIATAAALAVLVGLGPVMIGWHGIEGMALAACLSSLVSAIVSSAAIRRNVPVNYVKEIAPSVVCVSIIVVAGLVSAGWATGIIRLVLLALGLVLAYLLIYWILFDRDAGKMLLRWTGILESNSEK